MLGLVHCGRLPAPEDNQARNKDTSKVDGFQTVEQHQYNPAGFLSDPYRGSDLETAFWLLFFLLLFHLGLSS